MEKFFEAILSNQPLIATLAAWFLAQSLKITIDFRREHKFDLKSFALPGGFPSSHAAAVSALAISCGLNFGFGSGLFALSTVLAGIIIYDAKVVRGAAGKQAEFLNKIIDVLYKEKEPKAERLKEILGHTPFEILFGILLGIFVAVLLNL